MDDDEEEENVDVVGYGVLYKTRALKAAECRESGDGEDKDTFVGPSLPSTGSSVPSTGSSDSTTIPGFPTGSSGTLKHTSGSNPVSVRVTGMEKGDTATSAFERTLAQALLNETSKDPRISDPDESSLEDLLTETAQSKPAKKAKASSRSGIEEATASSDDITRLLMTGALGDKPSNKKDKSGKSSSQGIIDPSTAALLGIPRSSTKSSTNGDAPEKKVKKPKLDLITQSTLVQAEPRAALADIFARSEARDAEYELEKQREVQKELDELEKAIKDKSKYIVEEEVEFAGERIKVRRILQVGSREEQLYKRRMAQKDSLAQIVSELKGKKELSTLDKTKIDWEQDKELQGDAEELARLAKGGYLARQEFLINALERRSEHDREVQAILLYKQAAAERAAAAKRF